MSKSTDPRLNYPHHLFMSDLTENKQVMDWLTYKESNQGRSPKTINKYHLYITRLEHYLKELDTSLLDTTKQQLIDFTGIHLHKQKIPPASRKIVVASVRGFYTWLAEHGHIKQNLAEKLEYPKFGKKLPIAMQLKDAEKLLMQPSLDTFAGVRDSAIIALLISTGIRVSGLVNLNERDLIWHEVNKKNRLGIKVCEKGQKERLIPVDISAMLLIQAYLGHPELNQIDRLTEKGDKVLFINFRNGKVPLCDYRGEHRRLSQNAVWNIIQKHGEAAGIAEEKLHPHALRHLLGVEMGEHDLSTIQMSSILGHSKPEATEIYVQMAIRKMTELIDKANPFSKINSPVKPLVTEFKKQGII